MTAASPSVRTHYLELVDANPSPASMCGGAALAFDEHPGLAERVRTFWGDTDDETSLTEVQILALHAGAFDTTDPDVLWLALERAVATVPTDLDIPSESAVDLLAEVWAPVNDMWQLWLPAMEQAGRHFVSQYERGASLDVLITPGCDIFRERLPRIAADIEGGKPVDFVPCLFFGSSLYLDFPDVVVIGIGVGAGDGPARARTESVARRLKAVADPTRLAILHSLAAAPSSVGELATFFRLAQPTVSMHVKVLRESGLVHSERQGGRLRLRADPGAVEALLDDLRGAVLHGTTPDDVQAVGAS
jgi:DNA-binding transcriptional ArsR family regulator